MANYVVCLAADLKKDVDLYLGGVVSADLVDDLAGVGEGDIVILYTHGQYRGSTNAATNRICWFDAYRDGNDVAARLRNELHLPALAKLTIIVHACFSAGSVEVRPAAHHAGSTFAGVLCSALRPHITKPRVIGFVGQTKVGKAGFPISGARSTRASRRRTDPNEGEFWQVLYKLDPAGSAFVRSSGEKVVWS